MNVPKQTNLYSVLYGDEMLFVQNIHKSSYILESKGKTMDSNANEYFWTYLLSDDLYLIFHRVYGFQIPLGTSVLIEHVRVLYYHAQQQGTSNLKSLTKTDTTNITN